jgi:hypothetical protein
MVGHILIILDIHQFIHPRSVPNEFEHSSTNIMVIFSKTAPTILIKLQSFMEPIPLNRTAQVIPSGK